MGIGTEGLLVERLRERGSALSRAERVVAEFLVTVPVEDLPFLGAARIAELTSTSDATVTRTARRLGFSGLPELKRVATRPARLAVASSDRLVKQAEMLGDDVSTIAATFTESLRELVDDNAAALDIHAFTRARDVIAAARTVWAIGVGTSGAAAQYLADRLTRIGHPARWTRASGFDLASELLAVRPDDAVVLVHAASDSRDFDAVVTWARTAAVPLVLITGTRLGERHRADADAVITCAGTASQIVRWTVSALHTAELVALIVSAGDRERAVEANHRLGSTRDLLVGRPRSGPS